MRADPAGRRCALPTCTRTFRGAANQFYCKHECAYKAAREREKERLRNMVPTWIPSGEPRRVSPGVLVLSLSGAVFVPVPSQTCHLHAAQFFAGRCPLCSAEVTP